MFEVSCAFDPNSAESSDMCNGVGIASKSKTKDAKTQL